LQCQKVEEKLHHAKEQAESATQAKSEFLAVMSHEIRTPLSAVVGAADLLKEAELPSEVQSIVDMLQINSEMLLRIINDILDISRIESGKIELEQIEFNVNIHIEKVCRIMEIRVEKKGIKLHRNIDHSLPWIIKGDPARLQQVLMNLIDNAIKFTGQGHITVSCGYSPDNPAEFIFSVTDTGIGISEDKQESIFQNFSQGDSSTTRKFGGTGLGLTISRHLVELMGGRIWVKSKRGQGSTFYFTIRPEIVSMEGITGSHPYDTEKEKINNATAFKFHPHVQILLVEDYEYNQTLVLSFLKDTPIKIDIAKNGIEAVKKFQNKKYDLILMDLQMPIMDGYIATREIRKIEQSRSLANTPIIALSAFVLAEERQKSLDAGCNAHVSKPVKKDELLEVIARHLPAKKMDTVTPEAIHIDDVTDKNNSPENPAARVDQVFKKIIPQYINDLKKDVHDMTAALVTDDYASIKIKAHNIKGSGGGYGFDEISRMGKLIEDAAEENNPRQIEKYLNKLSIYIENISADFG